MRGVIHADGAEEKAEDDDGNVQNSGRPAKGVPLDLQVEVTWPHEGQHSTCQRHDTRSLLLHARTKLHGHTRGQHSTCQRHDTSSLLLHARTKLHDHTRGQHSTCQRHDTRSSLLPGRTGNTATRRTAQCLSTRDTRFLSLHAGTNNMATRKTERYLSRL